MFKTVYKILETFQLQQTPVYSEACYRLATLNAVGWQGHWVTLLAVGGQTFLSPLHGVLY